jgi:Protein of unknown function (DUF4012)
VGRQRIRVVGAEARVVAVIAMVSGLVTAARGPEPTGENLVDVVLVLLASAACVWSAASAPWWTGVVVAAGAAAFAPNAGVLLVGLVASSGGLWIGVVGRTMPWSRALVAGASVFALAQLGNVWFFGASALIGIGMSAALTWFGFRRRPRRSRKRTLIVAGTIAGVGLLAIAGAAIGAAMARSDLEVGTAAARDGIALLADRDLDGATAVFAVAAAAFDRAEADLGRPWTQLGRFVPVVAQHRKAAVVVSESAAATAATLTQVLASLDVDSLRLVDGRIDLLALAEFTSTTQQLTVALAELDAAIADAGSGWLVEPLRRRLNDVGQDVRKELVRGQDALQTLAVLPAMLGVDEPRVYFIAFPTPVESRGLSGTIGNWAEITITDGRIEMSDFGRSIDLNQAGDPETRTLTGPREYLDRYGPQLLRNFGKDTSVTKERIWSDISNSPHFPYVGEVIAELYPQSGGSGVDGAFSLDPFVIARLLQITGPIRLTSTNAEITADNAVQFMLRDQYEIDDTETRVDLLEEVARGAIERLLVSPLPSPPDLVDLLGPMAEQGRLNAWAARPDEQAMFERLGLSGVLPTTDGMDGLAFTIDNWAGNKIDAYLEGGVDQVVTINPDTGEVATKLTFSLSNTAPASGLPNSVIGNVRGLPVGTNYLSLAIFSPLSFVSMEIDGEQTGVIASTERGYSISAQYIELPAKKSVTVIVNLAGQLDQSNGYGLVVKSPPLVNPFPITVSVDDVTVGGEPVVTTIERSGVSRIFVGR